MNSMLHEGLLLLFRNRPTLAPELLQDVLGVALPAYTEARIGSAELKEAVPTEYRADLVVLLLNGKPVHAIVVEVQLRRDKRKRRTWPLYLTHLHCRLGCPTSLLVVAPRPEVARWCAQPIPLGHPRLVLEPLVLGPDAIPIITGKQEARRTPELAILSAMAHGRQVVAWAVARAAFHGTRDLEAERRCLYMDLVVSSLNGAARAALEEMMGSGNYEYQSDFARKYFAQGKEAGWQKGLKEGRKAGMQEGRREGMQEGRREGMQEGRQEGKAMAVLEVLDARGVRVNAVARRQILACTDLTQLKKWLRRAATAASVKELFGQRPASTRTARQTRPPRQTRPGASSPARGN